MNVKYKLEHGLRIDLIWRTELNLLLRTSLNKLSVSRLWTMERVTKENERVSKANLWINYCILEIKADNEPAISLPVYFKFVKKWKYVLRKKNKTKQNKTEGQKKTKERKENFRLRFSAFTWGESLTIQQQ